MGRHIRQVELSDDAFEAVELLRQRNGMTQKEIIARLMTWIASLEPASQQLVFGRLPLEYAEDAAERLANDAVAIARVQYGAQTSGRLNIAAKPSGKRMSVVEHLPDPEELRASPGRKRKSV